MRIGRLALSASLVLSIALLAGRLSGLIRELELAAVFGVSGQADVAILLLTLPDLLTNLLLAGGLSAALVPRLRQMAAESAAALFRQVSAWALLAFGIAAAAFVIWPTGVFHLLAPGLVRPQDLVGALALACVGIAVPLTSLSGVATAYLNANQRFLIPGCGTLIFNLCIIAALNLPSAEGNLTLLAVGIAAGAVVRYGTQLAAVPAETWRGASLGGMTDRRFLRAFGAGVVAAGLTLAAPIIVRAIASVIGAGEIAAFNYAQKVVELPIGILITTISTVALTRLSGLYAEGRTSEAESAAYADLRRGILVSQAVVLLGIGFAGSFIALAFDRGAMTQEAIQHVTELAEVALVGVPFVAIASMATASLNAQLLTPTVLKITALSLATLPLFALPGLMLSSGKWLMAAVVGFQAVLAFALAKRARFKLWGAQGICSPPMIKAVVLCAAICAAFLFLGWMADAHGNMVGLMVGGAGFFLATVISIRALK